MQMTKISQGIIMLALCALLMGGVTGCARSADPHSGYKSQVSDPLEPVNRGMFAFNNVLDMFLIEPAAKIYVTIFPDFVRDSIQSFMRNLKSPLIVANNLLQGDISGAGVATARFVINTTAGIGGLVDVASAQGLPYAPEDFGQTLAVWGFGEGFYIVLPVVGASNLRDTVGMVADAAADPVRIIAHNNDNDWIYYTRNAIEGLDTRARLLKTVEDLRKNSLDYYAAVRSAYTQKRASLVRDERVPPSYTAPDYYDVNE